MLQELFPTVVGLFFEFEKRIFNKVFFRTIKGSNISKLSSSSRVSLVFKNLKEKKRGLKNIIYVFLLPIFILSVAVKNFD
jgi:hypothetical protein